MFKRIVALTLVAGVGFAAGLGCGDSPEPPPQQPFVTIGVAESSFSIPIEDLLELEEDQLTQIVQSHGMV